VISEVRILRSPAPQPKNGGAFLAIAGCYPDFLMSVFGAPTKVSAFILFAMLLTSGCGGGVGGSAVSGAEYTTLGGTEALVWGEGDYGVVLSHGASYDAASWEPQAKEMARNGMVVLAVEDTSGESVATAAKYLKEERAARGVALVGSSAGTSGVLEAAEAHPELPDQLIILSGAGDVSGLGAYPKLFVASEGEGLAQEARRMAEEAPGTQNEALIVAGDAHAQGIFDTKAGKMLMDAILERLRRYR
jgi:pimeloyl-ACP methyl ester carboxylesterase